MKRKLAMAMIVFMATSAAAQQTAGQSDLTGRAGDASTNIVWRADAAVQRTLQASRAQEGPAITAVSRVVNWWGGTGVIVFAAVLWLGGRVAGRDAVARIGLRGAEGIAIASAISGIAKGLSGRARPFLTPGEPWHWDFNHGWSDARYFSMPSGHTTATVAFAVAAAVAAWQYRRAGGPVFGVVMILSGLGVAFARLYANQHWLSDVVVAIALGTATSMVLARLHARGPATGYHRVMLGASGSAGPRIK